MKERYDYYIDASTTNMGIVLCSNYSKTILVTSLNFKKYRSKNQKKAIQHCEKIKYIDSIFSSFIERFPVDENIVLEGIFVQSKFRNSSEILLKLHGYLIGKFIKNNISYISPATVKKTIAGNGQAAKEIVRTKLEEEHNIHFKNNDESDAFALLITDFEQKQVDISNYSIIFI